MALRFDPIRLPAACQQLRGEVRRFLDQEIAAGTFDPQDPSVGAKNEDAFVRRVAEKGWIGYTWPREYGGRERSFLERYVITEEMRVVNAPTRKFFVADRQSGPVLIRYGSEQIKNSILPRIVRGEVTFCIGMSEPDSGSDLFAARARAKRAEGGWALSGTKIWTSNAHFADYMIGLFRTDAATSENRRHGLTSFLVDMKSPGISVRNIGQMTGSKEFCEVHFDNVAVGDAYVIGEVDGAWKQATSELAYERSGPERFLDTYQVLAQLVAAAQSQSNSTIDHGIGRLVAQLHTLRRMSLSVAGMLEARHEPVAEAAIVKDLGTLWEQGLPQRARELASMLAEETPEVVTLRALVDRTLRVAPKFTIQGGTTEILRGIIARSMGLR